MPLLFQWLGGPANPLSTWPSQAECLVDTCKKRGTGLRWIQMSQGILLCPVTFRSFGELEIILCFLLSIWIHCCMSLSHLFILRKHCEWEPAHPDEDPKNEQTKTWSSNSRRIPDLEDPLLLPAPIFCLDDLPSMFWTAGCLCIFVSKCVKTCLQAIEIPAKLWGQSRAKIMDLNTATCGFSNLKELILDVMNPRFLGAYIFPQKYGLVWIQSNCSFWDGQCHVLRMSWSWRIHCSDSVCWVQISWVVGVDLPGFSPPLRSLFCSQSNVQLVSLSSHVFHIPLLLSVFGTCRNWLKMTWWDTFPRGFWVLWVLAL